MVSAGLKGFPEFCVPGFSLNDNRLARSHVRVSEAINKLDFNNLIIMSNVCKCHPNPLDSKEPCGLVTSAKDVGSIS